MFTGGVRLIIRMNTEKLREFITFYLINYIICFIVFGGWTLIVNEFQLEVVFIMSGIMAFPITLMVSDRQRKKTISDNKIMELEAKIEDLEKKLVCCNEYKR